jgi:hypothetical protein
MRLLLRQPLQHGKVEMLVGELGMSQCVVALSGRQPGLCFRAGSDEPSVSFDLRSPPILFAKVRVRERDVGAVPCRGVCGRRTGR